MFSPNRNEEREEVRRHMREVVLHTLAHTIILCQIVFIELPLTSLSIYTIVAFWDSPTCKSTASTNELSLISWLLVYTCIRTCINLRYLIWNRHLPAASAPQQMDRYLNIFSIIWLFVGWGTWSELSKALCPHFAYHFVLTFLIIRTLLMLAMVWALVIILTCPPVAMALALWVNSRVRHAEGLQLDELRTIPTIQYHLSEWNPNQNECAICLVEYEEDDAVKRLPCNHYFHDPCISRWLVINRLCPLCRQPSVAIEV